VKLVASDFARLVLRGGTERSDPILFVTRLSRDWTANDGNRWFNYLYNETKNRERRIDHFTNQLDLYLELTELLAVPREAFFVDSLHFVKA
jgi:hypothetical protein